MESDHLLVELYRRVAIATEKLKEIAGQSRKLGASIERTGTKSDASRELMAVLERLSDEYHLLCQDVECARQALAASDDKVTINPIAGFRPSSARP